MLCQSFILRKQSSERAFFLGGEGQDITVEIASIVYISQTTVYVNTYLAIATDRQPWQRHPSVTVDKATPFSVSLR